MAGIRGIYLKVNPEGAGLRKVEYKAGKGGFTIRENCL